MRPKKTILAIGADPTRQRILEFILFSRGYHVISVHPESETAIGSPRAIDLALCDADLNAMCGNDLVRDLKAIAPNVPMVLISRVRNEWPMDLASDAFLGKKDPVEQLLLTVRVLIARKRGPKSVRSLAVACEAVSA